MDFLRVFLIITAILCVSCNVMAASSMSVQILNWDGTLATSGLQFSDVGKVTTNDPWVRSNQYLRIQYNIDSKWNIWGIRIVTDNENNIKQVYPKPTAPGPDKKYENSYKYVGGQWQIGDDSVSFGGFIDPKSKNNPNYRAALAWQVFKDPVAAPDPIYKDFLGIWNVGGEWNDDWAYMADKSDKYWDVTKSQSVNSVGGIFYSGTWNQKYEMIITGDQYVSFLTQHPVVAGSKTNPDPKPGDGDIAVYIAACFGIMDDKGDYTGILPKGTYGTTIYLELVYE